MDTWDNRVQQQISNAQHQIKKIGGMFDDTTKLYMSVLIPILLIAIFLLFRNLFSKTNMNKMNALHYDQKIKLKNLSTCDMGDETLNHKLVDYYIASSYITPCIGDQHYDYVSKDMILMALNSGARLIQLPICQQEVYYESPPVIGTAEKDKMMITSMNYLNVLDTLNGILSVAFKHKNEKLNYPLFIQLELRTTNQYTLNMVADNLITVFGDLLIKPDKYYKFPLGLEKLCNLLNRVVIVCNGKYQDSKLRNIVTPTDNLFQTLHHSELINFNVKEDKFYKNEYNLRLSEVQQDKSDELFKEMYPDLDTIIKENEENSTGEDKTKSTILNHKHIMNNLQQYNKIGLTMVVPHKPEDVKTENYDFMEALQFGCQFISMNYQNNDKHMQSYVNMFKDNSFRLKPSGLRYHELQLTQPDIEMTFDKAVNSINIKNVDNTFKHKFNNKMVSIESYTSPGEYLITIGEGGSMKFTKLDTIQIENCFIIRENSLGSDAYSFIFESVKPAQKAITDSNISCQDVFRLDNIADMSSGGSSTDTIMKQIFYPLTSKNDESEFNSFKLVNDNNRDHYLGYFNGHLRGYKTVNDSEVMNNISFKLRTVKHKIVIGFVTLLGNSLFGSGNGIVGLKNESKSRYEVVKSGDNGNNLDTVFDDQNIYLKNIKNKKFLVVLDSGLLGEKTISEEELEESNTFILKHKAGFYQLMDIDGHRVLNYKGNNLMFKDQKTSRDSESLLKVKIEYSI